MSSASAGVAAIIVAAMPDELEPLLARATHVGEEVRAGNSSRYSARLDGHDVLFVRSGIGLVNGSSAITAALLSVAPDRPMVLSAGTAGGLGDHVRVGDVVVGSEYINVDADARAFGYVLGQVPRMPASYSPREAELALIAGTRAAAVLDERDGSALHTGLMVSSYSFVTPERATLIKSQFPGSLATDMESVAIAQVSYSYGLPFMSIRGISDLCGPAGADDFRTHVDDAADRSADVVLELLGPLLGK